MSKDFKAATDEGRLPILGAWFGLTRLPFPNGVACFSPFFLSLPHFLAFFPDYFIFPATCEEK